MTNHVDSDRLAISVIIPCYDSKPWVARCLASLSCQSLPREDFEIVMVFNGPDDGGEALARELLAGEHLQHQILHSSPGAPAARNVGTQAARGAWHTFVDIDDEVSPNYLEALWQSANDEKVIPLATMRDVTLDGDEQEYAGHSQIMEFEGRVSAADLWRPLSVTVLKLLPAHISRAFPFDTSLKSGEDVALFLRMFDEIGLDFDTTPAHQGAHYRRLVRTGSVGRAGNSYDFMVTQRFQVISILEEHLRANPNSRLGEVARHMIHSQAGMVRKFAYENVDLVDNIYADLEAADLPNFPREILPVTTDQLIVAYTFLPFNDPSSIVMLKRAIASGKKFNAISADMGSTRTQDTTLVPLAGNTIQQHEVIKSPVSWANWSHIDLFCTEGIEALDRIEERHPPQTSIYSRAMWAPAHFLSALIKGRRGVAWTAEFSDPLRKDVHGEERQGIVEDSPVSRELRALVNAAGFPIPDGASLFHWAEHIAYALADELVFTNPHQLTYMMGYVENKELRDRAMDRAVVQPQPTLPPEYYDLGQPMEPRTGDTVDLAYFGSFYQTRGLGDVLSGLRRLSSEAASRLRIHVFTSDQDVLSQALEGHPHRSRIVAYHPLPYLKFLRATKHYDVLIVNDAASTSHGYINPYLPSKLSDYRGSGTPIWGIVEPGSVLSRENLTYKTVLNDAQGAADLLLQLSRKGSTNEV